ncbi:MAG TPA: TMEM165/GDT1 family protein [Nitrososphaerales archaeon]|nr:TMEM165/GDT1 family protein [Nitrososphaerales archaeon]
MIGLDLTALIPAFVTIAVTIFIVELTDKDAVLLLTLATKIRPWTAFAAGSTAFTITSAIIVSIGYFLIQIVPIFWVRLVGGLVMVSFAIVEYLRGKDDEEDEKKLLNRTLKKTNWSIFFGAVSLLILLDLAGDATEVLTIVYVARFSNTLLVFLGAVAALVSASALETMLGRKLGKILSAAKIRILSLIVFFFIGSYIVITTLF